MSAGIHQNIPMADYLSGLGLPTPAVSGSDIVRLARECPAAAFAFWRGNPARITEEEASSATAFGVALHCIALEGMDAFHSRYAVKPAGMNFSTKEGRAWRDAQTLEIIAHDDYLRAVAVSGALWSNSTVARLLGAGGMAETTMIAQDPETGLWLLSRPDLLIAKTGIGVNLKTTRVIAPDDWRRQAAALRYDLGDAMFRLVARLCGIDKANHCFIVVDSSPPHLSYVAALSSEAAAMADQQLRLLLNQFAECVSSGIWPSYADRIPGGVVEIGMPAYAAQQIALKVQEGFAT